MSASDLQDDVLEAVTDHRHLILSILSVLVAAALLFALFGGGRVLGGLFVALYGVLWIAVVAFVLWLFYRLVVAAERIASAQERLASAETFPGPAPSAGESDDGGADTDGNDAETDG